MRPVQRTFPWISDTSIKKSPQIFVDPHISDRKFLRGNCEDSVGSIQLGFLIGCKPMYRCAAGLYIHDELRIEQHLVTA